MISIPNTNSFKSNSNHLNRMSERSARDKKKCEIVVDKVEKKDLGKWRSKQKYDIIMDRKKLSVNFPRCLIQCICKTVKGRFLNVVETPAEPVVCKVNSDCQDGGEICKDGKCLPGCRRDADCKEEENCQDGSCVNICKPPNACGTNALCKGTKHRKECSCPLDYLGNPQVECLPNENQCLNNPCGENAICQVTS